MTAPSLFTPLDLPSGTVLKNRIAKSAMSDSLGDGRGGPTEAQIRLYQRWAQGGLAVSIIGEVQGDPRFAEKPGNLVLRPGSDLDRFTALAAAGAQSGAALWMQLGHAGAMAHPPISTPKGPSALDVPGLTCAEFTRAEIQALPAQFAETARLGRDLGFGGVQIHAAHGFLLSQFLSPLFNRRGDAYGGPLNNRMRLVRDVAEAVRHAVGPRFPVAIKLNATDQLTGGLSEADALAVIAALKGAGLDLIDISGGTYFPGAPSASDRIGTGGPYFLDFAKQARPLTDTPLMLTGGFKAAAAAEAAIADGHVDMVGLARALVLEPNLPNHWKSGKTLAPVFPKFTDPPEGGVTAWYTMRLTEIGEDREDGTGPGDLMQAVADYETRDAARSGIWAAHFGL